MADIHYVLFIKASLSQVFDAVASPQGLNAWWALDASGKPVEGEEYTLNFGPEYDWRAIVTKSKPHTEFELQFTRADSDWNNTILNFSLSESGDSIRVQLQHLGWPELNEHYRISCYCWAMYLRLLRRYLELGEQVPYESRLDA